MCTQTNLSFQGSLGVAVDTTIPNIPYTDTSFAVLAEPVRTAEPEPPSTEEERNWLRLYGKESTTPVDWSRWEHEVLNGTRCPERAGNGWSLATTGPMTLREAVELCAANYPHNCAGLSWHPGATRGA